MPRDVYDTLQRLVNSYGLAVIKAALAYVEEKANKS